MEIQLNKTDGITFLILTFLFVSTLMAAFVYFNVFWGDSSIYLIYAQNIAAGNFFSFNPGEFSSGATSPLWAMILSVGFLLGNGVVNSKLISLIFVLAALFLTYKTSVVVTNSKIGSAIALGFLWNFLAFSGIFIYESGFTVCLISILILFNYFLIIKGKEKFIWYLGILWAILPLVRPESIVITFLNMLLIVFIYRKNIKMIYRVLGVYILALTPFLLYSSYSYLKTGLLSTSSFSRAYSLRVIASNLPNAIFNAFYLFFFTPIVLMGLFIGFYGALKNFNKRYFWLLFLFATVSISFIIIFMFYSPINRSLEIQRYILIVIPFVVPFISLGVMKLIKLSSNFKMGSLILISLIILVLVVLPPVFFINTYPQWSGLNFDSITEKNAVTYLNNIAEPNTTVLAYEVQDRYYLRNDLKILSLDGITDGKVVPFLMKNDITGFLWKYKPRYMIINEAVYLPTYSNSILRTVVDNIGNKEGSSIKIDGITFKNIKVRNEPVNPEFWGYIGIYELSYD